MFHNKICEFESIDYLPIAGERISLVKFIASLELNFSYSIDLSRNDVKRKMPDVTQNLIGC